MKDHRATECALHVMSVTVQLLGDRLCKSAKIINSVTPAYERAFMAVCLLEIDGFLGEERGGTRRYARVDREYLYIALMIGSVIECRLH